MKKFNNELLFYKWIKLILSIYHGENYYNEMKKQEKKIDIFQLEKILNNQIKLLKKRESNFYNISVNQILNFSILYKYKKI